MGEQPEQEQESRYQGVKVAIPDGDGEQIITFLDATDWDVYEECLVVYGSETDDPDDKNPVRIAGFPRNGWRRVWRGLREATEDEMEDALQHYDDMDTPTLSVRERNAFRAGWSARGDRL